MLDVVRRTAEACFMPVTVGGGVRTIEDIRALLRSGADKVSINTAAVSNRAFVKEAAEKFGDQCIVVAIDAKKVSGQSGDAAGPARWEIFTHGGRKPTGLDAIAYAKEVVALGAGEILLTSMDRDGTRRGFDIALSRGAIADAVHGAGAIASGGVGSPRSSGRGHPRWPCDRGCLPPRSFISASIRCARRRSTWRRPACRCGSMPDSRSHDRGGNISR